MSEAKREVWVIEDEDGFIVRPCLIKSAAEREAVSAAGERVVRYVPADAAQALADLRTLDEWAERQGKLVTPHPFRVALISPWYVHGMPPEVRGATPDEARAKAAAWVLAKQKEP